MPGGDGGAPRPRPGDGARVVALGAELRRLHDRIREVLDDARDGLDATATAASLTDDLVLRCRAVCTTLGAHHRDEDAALFPWLRRAFPDLGPVADRLEEDHAMIGALLSDLEHLVGSGAPADLVCSTSRGWTPSWRATSATRSASSWRCWMPRTASGWFCLNASGVVGERVSSGGGSRE